VLDDAVQHLCIPRQEIDRYQRLARGGAGSGVESFLSASFGLTIVPVVRAHLFAYRLSATLGGPPVFAVVPMTLLAKFVTVRRPQLLSGWPYYFLAPYLYSSRATHGGVSDCSRSRCMDWRAGATPVCTVILTERLFTLFSASIAPSPVAIAVPFHS
jgi:hypothetical protein